MHDTNGTCDCWACCKAVLRALCSNKELREHEQAARVKFMTSGELPACAAGKATFFVAGQQQ